MSASCRHLPRRDTHGHGACAGSGPKHRRPPPCDIHADEVAKDDDGIATHTIKHAGAAEHTSNPNKISADKTHAEGTPDAQPHPVFLPHWLGYPRAPAPLFPCLESRARKKIAAQGPEPGCAKYFEDREIYDSTLSTNLHHPKNHAAENRAATSAVSSRPASSSMRGVRVSRPLAPMNPLRLRTRRARSRSPSANNAAARRPLVVLDNVRSSPERRNQRIASTAQPWALA